MNWSRYLRLMPRLAWKLPVRGDDQICKVTQFGVEGINDCVDSRAVEAEFLGGSGKAAQFSENKIFSKFDIE